MKPIVKDRLKDYSGVSSVSHLSPEEFVAAADAGEFNGRFSAIAAELEPRFLGQVVAIMMNCTQL